MTVGGKRDAHPWSDVIPAEDVAAFHGGGSTIERPLDVGIRPALIIVDMTRAFVDSAYSTGWSATGRPAVASNRALLDAARRSAVPVIFTKNFEDPAHSPSPAERGRWKASQVTRDDPLLSPGDVIVDELTPRAGETVLYKQLKPSAFYGTQLSSLLVFLQVDTLIVAGMTTSGCVRATVVDAFQLNLRVIVPHETCADRSQISHKVSLFDMHMKYADVVSLDAVIDYLAGLGAQPECDK